METKTIEALERELEAINHLVHSRGKQINALREELAGEREVNRLLIAFLPLLALAAARDSVAGDAVRVTGSKDVLCVNVDKNSIFAALGSWQLKTVDTADSYRLAFEKLKEKE